MLKKILNTFGIRAFSAILNLLIAVLLSQYLGPSGKGTQSIILTTISFILIFSNLVGGATLVYLTPRFNVSLLLVPSYVWTIFMGLISYFILKVSNLVESIYIPHICVLAVINSFMSIHSNILIGKERIRESNNLVLFQTVILILSLLAAFTLFKQVSVNSYIASLYISMGVCMVISAFFIGKSILSIRLFPLVQFVPVVIQLFRYGFQNQVAHITQMLSFRLSYYVLDEYKGVAAVGVYSNGISIAESIWLVAKSMALVQYSWVSNSTDHEASARMTIRLVKGSVLLSLIIVVPLLLLPVSGYTFIFGGGFAGVKPIIWSLLPGVLIYNLSILFGHYFSGTGRYYINTTISSAGLAVSAILYFTFIPMYSETGAGIATSLSYIFTSMLFLWFFSREYGLWYKDIIPCRRDFKDVISELRKGNLFRS
jgi:O-antigen/teichoic acid export membrane protein